VGRLGSILAGLVRTSGAIYFSELFVNAAEPPFNEIEQVQFEQGFVDGVQLLTGRAPEISETQALAIATEGVHHV
jgi:hypothetical protein